MRRNKDGFWEKKRGGGALKVACAALAVACALMAWLIASAIF